MSKFNEFLITEKFENEEQASAYLKAITGQDYSFAISSHRQWGEEGKTQSGRFRQIMPETIDNGFFDWYCIHKPYYQFFTSMEIAVLHFLFYWSEWNKLGKPAS